jgi:hypothetical protein
MLLAYRSGRGAASRALERCNFDHDGVVLNGLRSTSVYDLFSVLA